MNFLPQEIIRRKRAGEHLSEGEIQAFFDGFLSGAVADYQVAAWLMAVYFRGMSRSESAHLTRIMRDSGVVFDWGGRRSAIVDKHSTGGVGDKTSMIILPLVVLEGLKVPMMAGRGLGHTGGTLDKLEAVGVKVMLEPDFARRQVERWGGVFMGQTPQVVPLDQRLYALRDVTATVESIPLIVASILSKKLAEGIGGLVMDVKFGSGAFMASFDEAERLATELAAVGGELGLAVSCFLTSMEGPLGRTAGNALEIHECLDVLKGGGPADTRELSLELASEMVRLAKPHESSQLIKKRLASYLADGSAYERFLDIAVAQGADRSLLENSARMCEAPVKLAVLPKASMAQGTVQAIDVRKLGLAVIELGGGRRLVHDKIDPLVGLSQMRQVGEVVGRDEALTMIHARDRATAERAAKVVAEAYQLGEEAVSCGPLIRKFMPAVTNAGGENS